MWPSAALPVDFSHNFLFLLLCQDKDFLKPLLHKIHVNPPAEVSTSLKVYQGHTLEKTYMGEDFFWAITPMAGDYVLFKFDRPVNIERSVCLRMRDIHTFTELGGKDGLITCSQCERGLKSKASDRCCIQTYSFNTLFTHKHTPK